jgi:8-oxo-dGTP diphosphatase
MQGSVFSGAKMAVIGKGQVLTLLRDQRRDIPYPGLWDLPGGGREFGETPVACAVRECWEEARLAVFERDLVWQREYGHPQVPQVKTWFLVAKPGWLVLPVPRLGDEGQAVTWMPVEAFLALDDAVPHLQARLRDYLAEEKAGSGARGLSTG